jgi:hypothetical protein
MPHVDPVKKAEYARRYREKNKEKIKLAKQKYYEKNKAKIIEKNSNLQASKKELKAVYDRKRRQEKREDILQNKKEYYASNKERIRKEQSEYRALNKEKIKVVNLKYIIINKEILNIKKKDYYKKNKTKIIKKNKLYQKDNKEKLNVKRREREKNRFKNDLCFKLKKQHSALIRSYYKNQSTRKKCKTYELLGCSGLEFKLHIESLWEPWMNWDNYGRLNPNGERTWQIDHKIPVSHFNLEDIEQAKKAFHHTNCRPLCSRQNIVEGNRR